MIDLFNETLRAEKRIRSYIRETPLESSPNFDGLQNTNVFFKCENLQYTGSFKVRGALSKGFAIQNKDLLKGVVTASTGNHGAATAFALSKIGYKGTIFVPENASKVKISNIERHGGIIKFHGSDSGETEFFARNYAKKNNLIYLPPYNDPQVIGGQGTIAIELKNQLKKWPWSSPRAQRQPRRATGTIKSSNKTHKQPRQAKGTYKDDPSTPK